MFNIQHITVRRLVTVSAVSTLVAVGLMVMAGSSSRGRSCSSWP